MSPALAAATAVLALGGLSALLPACSVTIDECKVPGSCGANAGDSGARDATVGDSGLQGDASDAGAGDTNVPSSPPIVLYGGAYDPTCVKIAGSRVYWAGLDGTIASASKDDGGGMSFFQEPKSTTEPVVDCAIDAMFLYQAWDYHANPSFQGSMTAGVGRFPAGGGTDVNVSPGANAPMNSIRAFALAPSAEVGFVSDPREGAIKRCIYGVGCLVVVTDPGEPYGVTTDSDDVYWTDLDAGTIMSALYDGGDPTMMARDPKGPRGIAVDESGVYWVNSAGSVERERDGGTSTLAQGSASAEALVVDETYVYWVTSDDGHGGGGQVKRCRKDGSGQVVILASGQANPWALAVDKPGGYVYWANNDPDGGILKVKNPP